MHRSLPATRHRDFRWLWASGTASSISLWTLLLGNAWIVFKLSDSSMWVGVATFASMFPYFLAPFGGVVADRFERRSLLLYTRIGSMLLTAVLFALAAADLIAVWLVVLLAFAQGVVRSAEMPTEQAQLANVVPPADISNAVTLFTTTRLGSRAVGPLLAGPLLAGVGVAGAYGIALVFSVLACATILPVSTRSRGGVADFSNVFVSLREGVHYVARTGPVAAIFLLVVAHCTMTMSFDAMLPAFADNHLHDPTHGFTFIMMGVGLGAFFGTLALAVYAGGGRGMLFFATAIVSGVTPILMAATHAVGPATASAVAMGASQAMFMALAAVFIQEVVHDAVRGRVMSLYLMSAGGLMAVANLGYGSLADAIGVPVLFLVPGSAFIIITIATLWTGSHLRRAYTTGTIGPSPASASPA